MSLTHNKLQFTHSQKNRFDEERARLVLSHFFEDKYKDAEMSESPDIVNRVLSIGVEVTSSMNGEIQEAVSRAGAISGKTENELQKRERENIRTGRVIARQLPDGRYLAGTTAFWGSNYDFQGCWNKKLKKLNSPHFTCFQENYLFVFAWMADSEDVEEGIKIFQENISEHDYEKVFDRIYIFSGTELVEVYMLNGEIGRYSINSDVMKKISKTAREKVLEI